MTKRLKTLKEERSDLQKQIDHLKSSINRPIIVPSHPISVPMPTAPIIPVSVAQPNTVLSAPVATDTVIPAPQQYTMIVAPPLDTVVSHAVIPDSLAVVPRPSHADQPAIAYSTTNNNTVINNTVHNQSFLYPSLSSSKSSSSSSSDFLVDDPYVDFSKDLAHIDVSLTPELSDIPLMLGEPTIKPPLIPKLTAITSADTDIVIRWLFSDAFRSRFPFGQSFADTCSVLSTQCECKKDVATCVRTQTIIYHSKQLVNSQNNHDNAYFEMELDLQIIDPISPALQFTHFQTPLLVFCFRHKQLSRISIRFADMVFDHSYVITKMFHQWFFVREPMNPIPTQMFSPRRMWPPHPTNTNASSSSSSKLKSKTLLKETPVPSIVLTISQCFELVGTTAILSGITSRMSKLHPYITDIELTDIQLHTLSSVDSVHSFFFPWKWHHKS